MKNKISAIILNWNGENIILECLKSLLNQTYKNLEIIIIDNGSTDDSFKQACDFLKKRNISFKSEKFPENTGFANGMNAGIKIATGEYVILLNEDLILDSNYLEKAMSIMSNNNELGGVGGLIYKLINGVKTSEIDATGSILQNRFKTRRVENPDEPSLTFGVSGSCPLFRIATLKDVELIYKDNYYDSDYFAYFEDMDLFFRCQLRGWKFYYDPKMIAWHVRSASMGGESKTLDKPDFFQVKVLRNRYLTIYKNLSYLMLFKKLPYFIITELALITLIIFKYPKSFKNLLRAYKEFISTFSETKNKRKFIQKNRIVSDSYINGFFKGF